VAETSGGSGRKSHDTVAGIPSFVGILVAREPYRGGVLLI
jgi:hypothetical protein